MDHRQTTHQTLVLMAGPPGAGKTSIATGLSRALGWPTIDKDSVKTPLLTVGATEAVAGPASYEVMFALGEDLLVHQGLSVILDSPAGYPSVVTRANDLARRAAARLVFVLCLADHAVRSQRLMKRSTRLSQWRVDTAILDDGRATWTALLPADTVRLDTTRPLDENVSDVIRRLTTT